MRLHIAFAEGNVLKFRQEESRVSAVVTNKLSGRGLP